MKIVILGEEKGLFANLVRWLNERGHQAVLWGKFYPTGNKSDCKKCPISSPDIILCLSNFVTYEDLLYMNIKNKPQRIYYNLGNKNVSNIVKDWRMAVFNDWYASYNPMHKYYSPSEVPDRFSELACLPLPFDYSAVKVNDYSQSELKVCQSLSGIAMMGAYSKQTMLGAKACNEASVPFDLIFDKTKSEAIARKRLAPVAFDNLQGMFGVSTLESMALGQAVICNVEAEIVMEYESLLGAKPPVLHASNKDDLIALVANLKSGVIDWKAQGLASRAFMEKHYNADKITKTYIDHFQTILGG